MFGVSQNRALAWESFILSEPSRSPT
jgi:hypothetical protein